jgi:hypothetical protein
MNERTGATGLEPATSGVPRPAFSSPATQGLEDAKKCARWLQAGPPVVCARRVSSRLSDAAIDVFLEHAVDLTELGAPFMRPKPALA